MSKEEVLKEIREEYYPDWEPAPQVEEVIRDVEELYGLSFVLSRSYYRLKTTVLYYLSMNCIDQFERGKHEQGMLTRKILEDLRYDLNEAEMEAEGR